MVCRQGSAASLLEVVSADIRREGVCFDRFCAPHLQKGICAGTRVEEEEEDIRNVEHNLSRTSKAVPCSDLCRP